MYKRNLLPPKRHSLPPTSPVLQWRSSLTSCTSPNGETTESHHVFIDPKRHAACLKGFQELFETKILFDVTLRVDDQTFSCHKSLLASSSEYFRALFTASMSERDKDTIEIRGISADAMKRVLSYLYNGQVQMCPETVQNVLSAADLFQLGELKQGCAEYMSVNMDYDNCIGIHFFANIMKCEELESQAWDMIAESFEFVSLSAEFLELSKDHLLEIIRYDDLHVEEEQIYQAACRWICHDDENRAKLAIEVFSHVRFLLINNYFLYDVVMKNKIFQQDPKLQSLLQKVLCFKLLRNRWIESDLTVVPRFGNDFSRVIVYTSYLDDEKKQVLQLYGHRSMEIVGCRNGNVLCDLPFGVVNPALIVTGDNELYLAGGDGIHGNSMAFYKFVTEDISFEELSDMPVPRKQFILVQVDDDIYAVGGCNDAGMLATVHKFSCTTLDWDTVCPMPKALSCCCAVAHQGKLYVFGGECEKANNIKTIRGKTELSNEAFCFDPVANRWQKLPNMPCARALANSTVYENKIYVIGGFASVTDSWIKGKLPENCLKSVDVYDPLNGCWHQGPELPTGLCAMGVVKYYGTIFVLGGESDGGIACSVYKLNASEWYKCEDMVTGVTEITLHSSYSVMNLCVDR